MSLFDLKDRVAIVTGGNDGIGRGIALELAKAGASVCIAGRNDEKSERVCREIHQFGGRAITSHCDVNVQPDIVATIQATEEAFGGLNIDPPGLDHYRHDGPHQDPHA